MFVYNRGNYSTKVRGLRGYLELFSLGLLLLFSDIPEAWAATGWSADIRAAESGFLERHAFGPATVGYTDVVPPSALPQYYETRQTDEGYVTRLSGTELSLWQTADVPSSSRYLLDWHFEYEGRVLEGYGRTGFIFGNPESVNLLSVEITRRGSLRLVTWGRQFNDPLGKIVWSTAAASGDRSAIRIEADYSIRDSMLVCRVNGGAPIRIKLTDYMPSAPMTIRGVGFFSAVPEARRMPRLHPSGPDFDIDIDMSRRHTTTRHERLTVVAK